MAGLQAYWKTPTQASGGSSTEHSNVRSTSLYTPAERVIRDSSIWTIVQGVLAPIQFFVFVVSLALIVYALQTGNGVEIAKASVVIKTITLYIIMVTGSIWEKIVFGKWLFAKAFYWEDMVSMLVLALHTAYLWALYSGWGGTIELFVIALLAYAAYVINAAQFILKLRAARLGAAHDHAGIA